MVAITASNTIQYSNDTNICTAATSYTLLKTINVTSAYTGSWRIYYEFGSEDDYYETLVYARVYKNGVAYGTEQSTMSYISEAPITISQDFTSISIANGDQIQLYAYTTSLYGVCVRNFRIEFDLPPGSASFTSSPTAARIWIDGVDKGVNTPATVSSLQPGNYGYTLRLSGYLDATGTFSVTAGSTTTVPLVTLIQAGPLINGTFNTDLSGWSSSGSGTSGNYDAIWESPGRARLRVYKCSDIYLSQMFKITWSTLKFGWETSADNWMENAAWKLTVGGIVVYDEGIAVPQASTMSGNVMKDVSTYNGQTATIEFRITRSVWCGNSDHGNTYMRIDNVINDNSVIGGDISFSSTPTGATIWINDVNIGQITPYTKTGLSEATHSYRLIEAGYTKRGSAAVTIGQTTNVSETLTPVGLNGSIWIEDQYLCYIDTNNVVTYLLGTNIGTVAGLTGSIWIENTQLAYIDASNNKRLLPVTTLGIVAGLDGSLWIDSNYLYYISSGTQRYVSSWLANWNYRQMVTVSNTGSTLTDYQISITIDTASLISAGKMRTDCKDIRFTNSNGSIIANYWIESGINTSSTKIWIKIPSIPTGSSTIYLYYGNATPPSDGYTSSGENTFTAFDTVGLTEVDPDSKIVTNLTNITWSSLNPVALPIRNYTYKTIENLSGYIFDFEFFLTTGGSSAENDAHVYVAGVGDTAGSVCSQSNHVGAYMYYAPHCCGARISIAQKTSGTENCSAGITISSGTLYYCRMTRSGTTGTLNIFSNAARTSNIGGSPISTTVTSSTLNNILPMSQSSSASCPCDTTNFYYNKNGGWSSGYVQNLRLRKYTSPEPTTCIGGEEVSAISWLTNWNRRKLMTITGSTSAQTNYQMKLIVHKSSGTDTSTDIYLGTNVKDDFSDIRFTSSDGSTLLNYWIESYTSGSLATIWIKIPSVPASPCTTTIYTYYNNSSATSTSNGDNTFDFFDDFPGTSLDAAKWTWSAAPGTVYGTATLSVASSILTLTGGLNTNWILRADKLTKPSFPLIIEYYAKTSESASNHGAVIGASDFQTDAWGRNGFSIGDEGTPGKFYRSLENNVLTQTARTTTLTSYTRIKMVERSGGIDFYENNVLTQTITTNSPEVAMSAWMYVAQSPGVVYVDFVFIRRYASPEPTFSTISTEQILS